MKLLIITSLFSLFHFSAHSSIKVEIKFSPITNLVYQLDCISSHLSRCSIKNYQALWNKSFLQSAEDYRMIERWSELMKKYGRSIKLSGDKYSSQAERVSLAKKLRIASFQSANKTEYFNKLDLVVTPRDRVKIEQIVNHFYFRFNKWWVAEAKLKGSLFVKSSEELLKSKKIINKLSQYSNFYEAELSEEALVTFNFLYRLDLVPEAMSGKQVDSYSVMEFSAAETAVEKIDVVIHELCHFFYMNSNRKKFSEFKEKFVERKKSSSMSSYNLLNEALAAALGNGIIARTYKTDVEWKEYKKKEKSFYNDYFIDKAAKIILPLLDQWLKDKRTIFDKEFVGKYAGELERQLSSELMAPKLLLNKMFLLADYEFKGKFKKTVKGKLRPSSMYVSEGSWEDDRFLSSYKEKEDINTLLIVHPKNIDMLVKYKVLPKKNVKLVKKSYMKNKSVIFSYQKTSSSIIYIVTASDYSSVIKSIDTLSKLKVGFDGVLH